MVNKINLRGHHLGMIATYKIPGAGVRKVLSKRILLRYYGKENTEKWIHKIKGIHDETDITMVKGLDELCGDCEFKTYCGSGRYDITNQKVDDKLGFWGLFVAPEFQRVPLDDQEWLEVVGVKVGETYKGRDILNKMRWLEYFTGNKKAFNNS